MKINHLELKNRLYGRLHVMKACWEQLILQLFLTIFFTISAANQILKVWEDQLIAQILLLLMGVFVWTGVSVWFPTLLGSYSTLEPKRQRSILFGASMLGIVWMLLLGVMMLPAPRGHTLEIRPRLHTAEETVSVFPMTRGEGFTTEPWKNGWGWESTENGFVHKGQDDGLLTWVGRTNRPIEIKVGSNGKSGEILFTWDGKPKNVVLDQSTVKGLTVRFIPENQTAIDWILSTILLFADWACLTTLSAVLLIFVLSKVPLSIIGNPDQRSWPVQGALILLPVFLIVWLSFYPAVFSVDSTSQVKQAITGQYSDSAPAIHTLFLAALLSIWNSPAILTLVQIALTIIVMTWSISFLGSLDRWPKILLWTVTATAALLPFVYLLTVTIWKDIPYSLAFILLVMMLVKIIHTRGRWLVDSPWSPWLLGLTAVLVATLRHNGLLAGFATLALLVLFGGKTLTAGVPANLSAWRRSSALALGVFLLCFFLIKVPLYQAMKVAPMSARWSYGPFMMQFGAMAASSTSLTPEEQAYVQQIYGDRKPISACDGNPPGFTKVNMAEIYNKPGYFWQMYARLFFRNPSALFNHLICQNRTTLSIQEYEKPYHLPPLLDVRGNPAYISLETIFPEYQDVPEYQPRSVFPTTARRLVGIFQESVTPSPYLRLSLWRPALFLAVVILVITVRALRCGCQWLWLLVPVFIHTASLIPLAHAYDSRYQYPIVLLGLIIWPWLFTHPRE